MSGPTVVVGGSGGIGAAIASGLGAAALVWSRRTGVDATDRAQVAAAAAALLAGPGPPWGLVHTVGDFAEASLLETAPGTFDALVASNLESAFHVVQALVPAMAAARRGRVILFAAAGASQPRAMLRAPVYFAVKAAVVHLARSLAAEVARDGVTVNVVSPGLIAHADSHGESQQRILPRVPAGRLGSVEDVAGLVRWLLSEESAYLTGQEITVDGGLVL